MPTDKKEKIDLNDPKQMKQLMVTLRDSIQDYLDSIDIEEAEKKAKEKK